MVYWKSNYMGLTCVG